jgi:hypothetical protein
MYNVLKLPLYAVKRFGEGDALQYHATRAFAAELGEVQPVNNPHSPEHGQHLFLNGLHLPGRKAGTIGEKMRMDPRLFPTQNFHTRRPTTSVSTDGPI